MKRFLILFIFTLGIIIPQENNAQAFKGKRNFSISKTSIENLIDLTKLILQKNEIVKVKLEEGHGTITPLSETKMQISVINDNNATFIVVNIQPKIEISIFPEDPIEIKGTITGDTFSGSIIRKDLNEIEYENMQKDSQNKINQLVEEKINAIQVLTTFIISKN